MYQEALYPKTEQVLDKLSKIPLLEDFYLAGGTALSLQLGHRKSVDLDFFSKKFPKRDILIQALSELEPKITQETAGTLDVIIDGVVVTFLEYKYLLLEELIDYEGVKMAGVLDIACMKLSAISSRGSKKDYIDLYKILQNYSLKRLFDSFEKKYQGVAYQKTHILKSLLHFDDAEVDPDPDCLEDIKWSSVKRSIERDVKQYLNTVL